LFQRLFEKKNAFFSFEVSIQSVLPGKQVGLIAGPTSALSFL
jgi:hypothetical protein